MSRFFPGKQLRQALAGASILALMLGPIDPLGAETLWQKARFRRTEADSQLLASLTRVVSGGATDQDQMRARVALVSLSRGEVKDLSILILLHQLRRQLKLSPSKLAKSQLRQATRSQIQSTFRALGHLELSYVLRAEGRRLEALVELERGLALAWQAETRSELHTLRGFSYLELRRTEDAEEAFEHALLTGPRGLTALRVQFGLSFASALRGDPGLLKERARRLHTLTVSSSRVSMSHPLSELDLPADWLTAADLVLAYGAYLDRMGRKPEQEELDLLGFCESFPEKGSEGEELLPRISEVIRAECPPQEEARAPEGASRL